MAITGAKLTKISTDSGVVGDWLTNDSTLVFSGTTTLSGASTLGIELNGVAIGTVSLGAGAKAWTFDYTKSALADGTYTIALTDGKPGRPLSSQTFTIDTAPPAAPDTLVLATDSGASSYLTGSPTSGSRRLPAKLKPAARCGFMTPAARCFWAPRPPTRTASGASHRPRT